MWRFWSRCTWVKFDALEIEKAWFWTASFMRDSFFTEFRFLFSFYTEKPSKFGAQRHPNRCQERSKIGIKNKPILEPQQATKITSKCLPFGALGLLWFPQGGPWEPSGAPKQDPCVIYTKFDPKFTDFKVYFNDGTLIFTPCWYPFR